MDETHWFLGKIDFRTNKTKETKETKYNNLWKTITHLCKYKECKRAGYGFGILAYCKINKWHTVSCNDKNCQKMKYALIKQGVK